MLIPSFNIQCDQDLPSENRQYRLLMEVGVSTFGYVLMDIRRMRPSIIKYYDYHAGPDRSAREWLEEIISSDEVLSGQYDEVILSYDLPESSLVPDTFFNSDLNVELTDLIYGNLNRGVVISEKIPWWELHNIYRLPSDIYSLFHDKFSSARQWHSYSLLLKSYKMFNAKSIPDFIRVIFHPDRFVLMLLDKDRLQVIQSFVYSDVKDVIYYIMNCCKQFNLDTHEMTLEVTGNIDKHSVLFNELLKYFLHLSFEDMDDSITIPEELREFPLHYFSTILKKAVCV